MNIIIYSFFIILFCFSNILAILEADPSVYSSLLGSVRREVVDNILKGIPQKKDMKYEQFIEAMKKIKNSYSLSEAEFAYLAYKWIAQNIDVQYNLGNKNSYPPFVYELGRGTPYGIALLFCTVSSNLGARPNLITGYVKVVNKNNYNEMISEIESAWNCIMIGGQTYLVDVSLAAGNYNENEFERRYTDVYFATKPNYFIYRHFPHTEIRQLLTRPIDLETFNSFTFVDSTFFLYGFYKFEPTEKEVLIENNLEFEINYNPNISNGIVLPMLIDKTHSYQGDTKIINYNGETEIIFNYLELKIVYLEISIINNKQETIPILIYKLVP